MSADKRLIAITNRIRERSVAAREAYLARVLARAESRPRRSALGCGNLAHGFAACGTGDKARLMGDATPNLGIITAYNDMLSAHQPYERYPDIIRRAARDMGATAQVAGGVPAMCDGVTQGEAGMELSLFSRDVIAQATAIGLSHDMFDTTVYLGVCDKIVPGLLIGALSHYRFIGVIGVGFIALLALPQGRRMLADPRVWVALAVGVLAWLPLLAWNADNHDAGLKFQVVERHPWAFEWEGLWFLVIQPMLVTPILCIAMWKVALAGTRSGGGARVQWRYFGLVGGVSTLGIFLLGFFTDVERISFHWPLPGYLALLVAVPVVLNGWPRWLRRTGWWLAAAGTVLAFGYYLMASTPALREQMAGSKYYPRNFAGWQPLAVAVRDELRQMPPGTRVLAGNFKVGAELGFQLGNGDIEVLPHPLNDKHGRTAQLAQWDLLHESPRSVPMLLVLSPSDQRYRDLLARYHTICEQVGPLPAPRVVSSDHGFQRFLLFRLPAKRAQGPCVTPAMAWLDAPSNGEKVSGTLAIKGWAFKDGVGLARVEVLVDGRSIGDARYGRVFDVRPAWPDSTDPQHPAVGFDASLDTTTLAPGRHWLGLRLHGRDGSVEAWQEQPFEVR